MKVKNIPIFVSHFGCPNDCIFCNQKKISGVHSPCEISDAKKIIEDALKYTSPTDKIEIAFFGGSFTGIDINRQEEYLKLASGYNVGIRLSTRPDYINDKILSLLEKYKVTTIELGVQSMIDDILKLNERGMMVFDTINAVEKIRSRGFSLGIQMMTSMYGSKNEDDIFTAGEIIKLKPDFVRIYPTVVIGDTKLYELYLEGKYKTKELAETVSICAQIYKLFCEANIPVIRLGLMSSEEIRSDKVIGAYHEAFGELVMTRYYYDKISGMIENRTGEILMIKAPLTLKSKIIGHKKENFIKFKQKFKRVEYIASNELEVEVW